VRHPETRRVSKAVRASPHKVRTDLAVKGFSQAVARRYAKALFETVRDAKQPLETACHDLASVASLIEHGELRRILEHPALPLDEKKKLLSALWSGSPPVARLVDLLLERRRLALIPAIERSFVTLSNAHRGLDTAEVVSARPIDPSQTSALRQALERISGLKVEMNVREDPGILGGVLVKMGGRVFDGTVRSRLTSLRKHLLKGTLGA
jgi:F-type H+-transporting ATPase subunit delta